MTAFTALSDSLGRLPLEYLALFVALGALALAFFAIHAVWSMAKGRRPHV
jgi:hypothetical protein